MYKINSMKGEKNVINKYGEVDILRNIIINSTENQKIE